MKREIDIIAYRCKKCGKLHYPFHDRCMACKYREFEPVKPEGNVKLLTFTRIYNLPWGFDQRYLIIGIGEFENGVKAMGRINVDESFPLATGMVMKPTWAPVRVKYDENVYGLMFETI